MKKIFLTIVAVIMGCSVAWAGAPKGDLMFVKEELAKFAPVKIAVDRKNMTSSQRSVVKELIAAAREMDKIFLTQVWSGNAAMKIRLEKAGSKDSALLDYFNINFGPYDRLDHDKPFIDGVPPKPEGANFYPEKMTKKDFEKWVKNHPNQRKAFESEFTVIRDNGSGGLRAVPYSEEYKDSLEIAAKHMNRAASHAKNRSLKKYLKSRAEAFETNDYFQSDVDWVRLKGHAIEVVIGPYEVYEDNLFGYKAAFEAFITHVDPVESKRLAKVVSYLDDLEKHLPIENRYKGVGRSLKSPIVVANLIYSAGDTKAGVQTLAFNLPNDERVRSQEGSKKVMLKNVLEAKFRKILVPIAKKVMSETDLANISEKAFFSHVLLHEISHGIGPGKIVKDGKKTSVNKELKDLYSVIEECKADTLGAYNNAYLIEKGLYPKDYAKVLWPTYLAGMFRSIRFGINEAHGGGNAIQLNYLLDKGGFIYDKKSGLFSVDTDRIDGAVSELAHELLMIEAKGNYAAAKRFVKKYRKMNAAMKRSIKNIGDVPVDIKPVYAYK